MNKTSSRRENDEKTISGQAGLWGGVVNTFDFPENRCSPRQEKGGSQFCGLDRDATCACLHAKLFVSSILYSRDLES